MKRRVYRSRSGRRKRNPPLTGVKQVGSNVTEVHHGDVTVLYSYRTPVAAFVPGIGYLRTSEKFSQTTGRHINKWLGGTGAKTVAQNVIARLASGGRAGKWMGNPSHLDKPYPHPGKFEGETNLAEEVYDAMGSGTDAELGSVQDFGWYGLLTNYRASDGSVRHVIAHESDQGFFDISEYDSAEEAQEAWSRLEDEYEEWISEEGE